MKNKDNQQSFIINIEEDGIEINNKYFLFPLDFSDLINQFGDKYEQWRETDTNNIYMWNNLGIKVFVPKNKDKRIEISIKTADVNESFLPKNAFNGELKFKNRKYLDFISITANDKTFKTIEMGNIRVSALISENEPKNIEEVSISEIVKDKITKIKSDKYNLIKISGENIEFTDFNFKLAIIQELMYIKQLIKPKFDIFEFIDYYEKREINIDEEGYKPIPEAIEYFKDLLIDSTFAEQITQIYQDGGNEIYMNITPYWDGEDDSFNIQVYEDIKHFPNLKKMTLFSNDQKVYEELKLIGIDAVQL